MKLKIFAAAFFSIALITSGFAGNPKPAAITREIVITTKFDKVIVGAHLTVVLVQDPNVTSIRISGDEKSVQYVAANVVKNRLQILAKRSLEGKKVTVYVPVKDISAIELSNGSSLSGKGVLIFSNLTVILNDDAHVELNAYGEINIQSGDNCDFVYERNDRYKMIERAF